MIDLKEIEENGVKSYVVDENNIWLFNTNLQSGELKQNIDKSYEQIVKVDFSFVQVKDL